MEALIASALEDDASPGCGVNRYDRTVRYCSSLLCTVKLISIIMLYQTRLYCGCDEPYLRIQAGLGVLCNSRLAEKITVDQDILPAGPLSSLFPSPPPLLSRSGTIRPGSALEDNGAVTPTLPSWKESDANFVARSDNLDNLFMEDVSIFLIGSHVC